MSLAQTLPELRRQLEQQLTNGDLPLALSTLRELLPDGSDKRSLVLGLQTRLQTLNLQKIKGLLSFEQYNQQLAGITDSALDLIATLEDADFVPAARPKSSAGAAREGCVLYKVPLQMPLRKVSLCTVRVAVEEGDIVQDIVLDDSVRLRNRVEISERMSAELLDLEGNVFQIAGLNAAQQSVREQGYTQWLFRVTPLVEGEHQLLVKVSLLAFDRNTNEYVPRDVSILETVTIVTEAPAPSDVAEPPFKASGERLALGPRVLGQTESVKSAPSPRPRRSSPGVAVALMLLLLSTSASWSFARTEPGAWLVTRYIQNDEKAYLQFVNEHPDSPHLEAAYYRRAVVAPTLENLRDYQHKTTQANAEYRTEVVERIKTLEIKEMQVVSEQPTAANIQQFLAKFPEGNQLPALAEVINRQPAEARAELLPQVEPQFWQTAQVALTAPKIAAFVQAFPATQRLPEVVAVAVAQPQVLQQVRPALEAALVQQVRVAQRPAEITRLLPALQQAASPQAVAQVEQLVAQKPAAVRRAVEPQLQAVKVAVAEREAAAPSSTAPQETGTSSTSSATPTPTTSTQTLPPSTTVTATTTEPPPTSTTTASQAIHPQMVLVKGGTYQMGDLFGDDVNNFSTSDEVAHKVTVSDFYLGKYEVTFDEYDAYCDATGAPKPDGQYWGRGQRPVINVSWLDAVAYCNWLSQQEGRRPAYTIEGKRVSLNSGANGYRLPTEAEWEYAAREGGKKVRFGNGKDVADPAQINFDGSENLKEAYSLAGDYRKKTVPVNQLSANALGFKNMSGNVYEWCWDRYDKNYYTQSQGAKNPTGPAEGADRVLRGGSWGFNPRNCRAAYRLSGTPANRGHFIGFRLASPLQ